jgi:hypothetical protein
MHASKPTFEIIRAGGDLHPIPSATIRHPPYTHPPIGWYTLGNFQGGKGGVAEEEE